MIDCKEIIKIIDKITDEDIYYLYKIGQDHEYDSVRQLREWTLEDEFWRQIGYAMRVRG